LIHGKQTAAPAPAPLLSRDFAHRIGWTQTQESKRRDQMRPPRTAKQDHYRGLTQGLIPYSLEVADHAAMAFSIEPRYPFFDKRLAEYCLAIPSEQKIFHGWTRMVMRRGMANILPERVQWRGGKADLSQNFFRSLLTSGAKVLEEMIRNPAAAIWEYVDQEALRRTYHHAVSAGDRDGALALWQAAALDSWLQRWDSSSNVSHLGTGQKHSECSQTGQAVSMQEQ